MRNFIQFIVLLVGFLFLSNGLAADKVVVIPLNSAKKLNNVVTVSAKGGDFSDPVAAVESITEANESNPYLLLIGPGVYTLTQPLDMKPFVFIAGSGQDVTILTGAISTDLQATSYIVRGADYTTLSDLTIENTGGSNYSTALYNNSSSPFIQNVTATASGGTFNIGVYNNNISPTMLYPTMTNVTVTATGGAKTRGVENDYCSPTMTNVTVIAKDGTANTGVDNENSSPSMTNVTVIASNIASTTSEGTYSYGVYSSSSSPTMTNVTIHATGGKNATGVYNGAGSLTMTNVDVFATGDTSVYGVQIESSTAWIRHSRLYGETDGILSFGTTRVMQSSILGGATNGGGTLTCTNSDNGVATELNSTCQ